MIRCIIIDDEINAVKYTKRLINDFFHEIQVIETCNDAVEGVKQIIKHRPDLILLDIEMPKLTGFDILERIPEYKCHVIFITAYNEYAVRAFKYHAFDYLVKPINIKEFKITIGEVIQDIRNNVRPDYKKLDVSKSLSEKPTRLALKTGKAVEYLLISDIIRIEADSRYSSVFTINSDKFFVSRSIGEFEDLLLDYSFFRSHDSHLINIEHIKSYSRCDGGFIRMVDDEQIPLSRRKKDLFMQVMERFCL